MRIRSFCCAITFAAVLSGCTLGRAAVATPTSGATGSPAPTSIPTARSPLAVLVVPADMDKSASDLYQTTVYELAHGSGMRFQVRNTFTPADIEPGLRVLIALPPDPGIAAIAAAAPHLQILAVSIGGVAAGGSVSTLASSGKADVAAFVAGYTAAMIGDHYRAGMILPKDDAAAQQAASAFTNGMAYYCGLCSSNLLYSDKNGQSLQFPQFIQIPGTEDPRNFGGWANYAVGDQKVNAVYVYPDPKLAVQQLYDALGQTGAQIIGVTVPNQKPPGWVMAIGPDEVKAIQTAWPDLLAGKGARSVPSPLGMTEADPTYLSPGKQRLVQKLLDDLQAGLVVTGLSP